MQWQGAALHWGSRKQQCIALSTCEAEIIALSEGAKDMVYFRKLVAGLDAPEQGPSPLSTDSQSPSQRATSRTTRSTTIA